jgi:hypothetical protein
MEFYTTNGEIQLHLYIYLHCPNAWNKKFSNLLWSNICWTIRSKHSIKQCVIYGTECPKIANFMYWMFQHATKTKRQQSKQDNIIQVHLSTTSHNANWKQVHFDDYKSVFKLAGMFPPSQTRMHKLWRKHWLLISLVDKLSFWTAYGPGEEYRW